MSDDMELLREFRADVPAPSAETRHQIYARATQVSRHHSSLSGRLSAALGRAGRSAVAPTRSRRLRLGAALAALALASGGAAIAFTATARGGSIDDLLAQVQNSFGGGNHLLSASVNGSTLTVNVSAPDEPSSVTATFEAQILAAAFNSGSAASGETPIHSAQFLDASGNAIPGYGPATVGGTTSPPPLSNGACKAAAQGVQTSSLVLQSARQLPYAGGTCVFTFQTSDPSSFAAGIVGYKLFSALGAPDQRPYLWEVDDQAGVPQFVDGYTPGGGGVAYVKPDSGILYGP